MPCTRCASRGMHVTYPRRTWSFFHKGERAEPKGFHFWANLVEPAGILITSQAAWWRRVVWYLMTGGSRRDKAECESFWTVQKTPPHPLSVSPLRNMLLENQCMDVKSDHLIYTISLYVFADKQTTCALIDVFIFSLLTYTLKASSCWYAVWTAKCILIPGCFFL